MATRSKSRECEFWERVRAVHDRICVWTRWHSDHQSHSVHEMESPNCRRGIEISKSFYISFPVLPFMGFSLKQVEKIALCSYILRRIKSKLTNTYRQL